MLVVFCTTNDLNLGCSGSNTLSIQAEMTYQFYEEGDYLKFAASGEYTPSAILESIRHIAKECDVRKKNKVLIDLLDVNATSIAFGDRIAFGKAVADVFGTRIKSAVVLPQQHIHEQKIGEVIATNRSAVIKLFSEIKPALEWLNQIS
jgi:hypothetical protein